MDSQGKSLKGKTPVQEPISKKRKKEEKKEEDGFTTPKGAKFRIPPPPESSLPAPSKNVREKSTLQRLNSDRDLNTFFSRAMDSPGRSLKGKIPVQDPITNKPEKEERKEEDGLSLKKTQENQAMDSPGKSVKGKIPVKAPINNKLEKKRKKEE